VQERIEHASFVDQLGRIEAELSEKDEMLAALDAEKTSLKEGSGKTKKSTPQGRPAKHLIARLTNG